MGRFSCCLFVYVKFEEEEVRSHPDVTTDLQFVTRSVLYAVVMLDHMLVREAAIFLCPQVRFETDRECCKSLSFVSSRRIFVHVRSPLSVVMTENTKGVFLFPLCYTHVRTGYDCII